MYEVGETVQFQHGGYILLGTVTESAGRGYMISGPISRPIFIHNDKIMGVFK